jgi:hypothetical protein
MAAFCSACGQFQASGVKFCSRCGAPTASPAEPIPYAPPDKQPNLRCKTCDVGSLKLEKKYRMSTPVVTIGYILLVPSILGIIFSFVIVFATGHVGSMIDSTVRETAASDLRQAGVPEPVVQKVTTSQELTEEENAALTLTEKDAVEKAESSVTAVQAGTGAGTVIAGGVGIFFAMAFFVSGLLGWLLVMKKRVLCCTNCSAIVPAS